MLNSQLESRWPYHHMCPRGEPIDGAAGRIRSGWSAPPWDHVGWRLPASAGPRWKSDERNDRNQLRDPFGKVPTISNVFAINYHHLPAHIIIWNHMIIAYPPTKLHNSTTPGLHMDSTGCLLGRDSAVLCLGRLWRLGARWSHGAHQEVQNSLGNTPPQITLVLFRNSNSWCWLWIHNMN